MNKRIIAAAVLSAAIVPATLACTNLLVGKKAPVNGSTMISYNADSHQLYGDLQFTPAADHQVGEMRQVIDWDSQRPLGHVPQPAHTYRVVGNQNEWQVTIGESTWGGDLSLMDTTAIVDYGSLMYIALERSRTAREAIDVMTQLVGEYGYASEGETFSIGDPNEIWVMDLIGKGPDNKGLFYVAIRIPDGYICAHANQARIQTFPQNDPENCIFSPEMISFAREKGYFSGKDEDFDFSAAFNPVDFGGARGCDARAWSAFNILCDGKFTYEKDGKTVTEAASDYYDYITGKNLSHRMPLFVKPARKITVKDVADVMRDHFEGTPLDMTNDIGAGGNALPYRWRPMGFKYEGWEYTNERAIATQQTGFWFVGQARHDLPDIVGGVIWFGTDDAATSYLTPIYTNTDKVPECFREGNGTLIKYSPTSSFWINNRITNTCYRAYDMMAPVVRAAVDEFENAQMNGKLAEMDAKALAAYTGSLKSEKKVRQMLTEYSVNTAQAQFEKWVALEEDITVRFIDGNVKTINEDGTFKLTQPGYTEKWKEAVVKDHGDVVRKR
jgi:dipeptidase